MKIRTQLTAGKSRRFNQNATSSALLAVRTTLKAGALSDNHNETLQTRTGLKAGRKAMRRAVLTTVRKEDRLELMVVRAGLRAGVRSRRS